MMIDTQFAEDGIGIYMVGEQTQRIAMHEEAVAL